MISFLAAPQRPTHVYEGFAARRELFTAGRLRAAAVIHLAAHAVAAPRTGRGAGLMLSRFDAAGRPVNGLLSLSDVEALDLSADLVVLAACRSAGLPEPAADPGAPAEGSRSLAEAFLAAGARRAVGTLWKVDDAATGELMVRFHAALWRRRLPPAAALRETQRQAAADGMPASAWAAFVLLGDWQGETP